MIKQLLTATALSAALLSGFVVADGGGNWENIQVNWGQMQSKIQEHWVDMSDDEFRTLDGSREEFVTFLRKKYGLNQEDAESQLDEWADKVDFEK